MSGNMYRPGSRRQNVSHWQSEIEIDNASVDDASSQYSEDCGTDGTRNPDVSQRILGLFKDQLYTDVKFVLSCGIKPKPTLMAHKAILAAGSKKFADMLYGENTQEISKTIQTEIQINNVPVEAFRNVVEYLYTDDFYFESDSVAMETLTAARTFQVQPLVDKCESYFEAAEVTEENACTKYQLATANKMESVKNRCVQFIQENTRDVIRSKDFKSSTNSTVRSICKLPRLNLRSETELFEAVVSWYEAQPESRVSKRDIIEPFLRHIRFLTMTSNQFSQLVQQCPDIFTAEEALNIVIYLSNPNQSRPPPKLPSWCNKGSNRCFNNAQPRKVFQDHHGDQNLPICLRPIRRGYLSNLISVLEMKCIQGSYQVKAVKLSFGEPVTELSCIGHLTITVNIQTFKFTEHIRIDNSREVVVPFSKNLMIRNGSTLHIRAEASEVRNYNFLQFDEEHSFSAPSPFECSLGSVPKDNRLFFISEVIYISVQPRPASRPARTRNFRDGKRT